MIPGLLVSTGASLQVSVSPSFISETATTNTGTTSATTVSVLGGVAPYTYSWAFLSGSSELAAVSPSAATTTFDYSVPSAGFYSATFRCTVTDTASIVETVDVFVSVSLGSL